jgi:hypothetical protein
MGVKMIHIRGDQSLIYILKHNWDRYLYLFSSISITFLTILKLHNRFFRDKGSEELAPDPRSMAQTIRSFCLDS